jgi:hypothetical protein
VKTSHYLFILSSRQISLAATGSSWFSQLPAGFQPVPPSPSKNRVGAIKAHILQYALYGILSHTSYGTRAGTNSSTAPGYPLRTGWVCESASIILYTLVETAKVSKLESWAYLNYFFERLPLAKSEPALLNILPQNLKMKDLERQGHPCRCPDAYLETCRMITTLPLHHLLLTSRFYQSYTNAIIRDIN